jgi:hypothetical protein
MISTSDADMRDANAHHQRQFDLSVNAVLRDETLDQRFGKSRMMSKSKLNQLNRDPLVLCVILLHHGIDEGRRPFYEVSEDRSKTKMTERCGELSAATHCRPDIVAR